MSTRLLNKTSTRKTGEQSPCGSRRGRVRMELEHAPRNKSVCDDVQPELQPIAARSRTTTSGRTSIQSPASTKLDRKVWTIVLAGGEGERLRPLITRWLGVHRPKQYCTFVGSHSMLRHTLDRAERITGVERTLVVVASHHEPQVWDRLAPRHEEAIIAQPRNRDTAAGVFLPLAHIGARDPEATVIILPSDHFVHPQEAFLTAIGRAVRAAQCQPDKLVLLGVRPDTAETEYGWIRPGHSVDRIEGEDVRQVAGFREKPDAQEAQYLLRTGGLWNTMVIAVRWSTIWQLGWRCFPTMMAHFEEFRPHIGTDDEMRALDTLYNALPSVNFSTKLLQQALDSLVVMELRGVLWSDWGSERRIVETLQRIGKSPLFMTAVRDRFHHEFETRP